MRVMHAFDVLGDPVRRRILELLADGELTSGAITAVVQAEFGITQPAVSQHLKVLRESGFATVRPDGARRLYAVDVGATPGGRRVARPVPPVLGAASRRARHRTRARQARTAHPRRRRPTQPKEDRTDDRHRPRDRSRPARGRQRHASPPARGARRPPDAAPTTRRSRTSGTRSRTRTGSAAGSCRSAATTGSAARYQFEGNAGGKILACERPNRLLVTWVYGEVSSPADISEVELRLTAAGEGDHDPRARAHGRRARRDVGPSSGPAPSASAGRAACSDWRSTSRGGSVGDPWPGRLSDEGRTFATRSSEAWGAASVAAGADPEVAASNVTNTTAFYTTVPEAPPES